MASILEIIKKLEQEQNEKAKELLVRSVQIVDRFMNLDMDKTSLTEFMKLALEKNKFARRLDCRKRKISTG